MNISYSVHLVTAIVVLLAGLLIILSGCDSLTTEGAPDTSTKAAASELRITEAPAGAVIYNLYSPLGPIMERNLGSHVVSTSKQQPERSPFACFLSSYRTTGEHGQGYYYRSIYLHFPESLVEVRRPAVVVRFEARAESIDHPSRISQVIVCRVPQNRRAIDLLQRRLQMSGGHPRTRPELLLKSNTRSGDSEAGDGIPRVGRTFSASTDIPQFYPRLIDGDIPNREGATCAAGYDWANRDQTICTDGQTIQLPVINIYGRNSDGAGAGGLPSGDSRDYGTPGSSGPYPEPTPREGDGSGTTFAFHWNDMTASAAYDCSRPYSSHGHKAHCTSRPPVGTRYVRTNEALARIRSKGGECARIADMGRSMLAKQKIRYFYDDPRDAFALRFGYGSHGSLYDPNDWISLDQMFPDKYYDANNKLVDMWFLDWLLVHEIEHFIGRAHVDIHGNHIGSGESPWTINSRRCAGME